MKQTWTYMGERFAVDTEDPESYREIVREMLDYNDCYDELVEYLEENVGNSADLLIKMIWEGAEYVADRMIGGFVGWMLDDMEKVAALVEANAIQIEEERGCGTRYTWTGTWRRNAGACRTSWTTCKWRTS